MISNETFHWFYENYYAFSLNLAYWMTGDRYMAEDISQSVFLKFYRNRKNLSLESEADLSWLVKTATIHRVTDYWRKSYVNYEIPLEDVVTLCDSVGGGRDVENIILDMEFGFYAREALNRLKRKNSMNYEILVKTKIWGRPAVEVAGEYGITPGNVNNRVGRARTWVREEFGKIYGN
ncbi:MAG: sigma-70 family RNA polymerase sigma factor [Clostridiales bacterium]|nr:sigma-70 family RNA polymerase sigma factor [Clostridiales bacterium]